MRVVVWADLRFFQPSTKPVRVISPIVGAEISVRMAKRTGSSSLTPKSSRYFIEPSTPTESGSRSDLPKEITSVSVSIRIRQALKTHHQKYLCICRITYSGQTQRQVSFCLSSNFESNYHDMDARQHVSSYYAVFQAEQRLMCVHGQSSL